MSTEPDNAAGRLGSDRWSSAWTDTPLSGAAWGPPAEGPHPLDLPADARYELGALLGVGGMGEVRLAYDARLQREVAIKTARTAPEGLRLAQEAWLAAQLDHPGIVPVFDAGRHPDGRPWYAMPVVRGRSLRDALAAAATPDDRLALLRHLRDACEAVGYAHQRGVVHRDLKPANIMVGALGETQVMDWGLARPVADADGAALRRQLDLSAHGPRTQLGERVGTPAYMSPEQALGEPVGPRSDVWSLGVILHELLAGAPPFDGETTGRLLAQIVREPPPPLPGNVAPPLRAVVARALARDPGARFPDAAALAAALSDALTPSPRRPPPRQGRPLMLGVGVGIGLATGLWVAAVSLPGDTLEPLRATLAQRDIALAEALTQQAITAAREGDRPRAELLAAQALGHADLPSTRGVLAAYSPQTRPTLLSTLPSPTCRAKVLSPDGEQLLCLTGDEAQAWSTDRAALQWSRPSDGRVARYAFDGGALSVTGGGRESVNLGAGRGEVLGEWNWSIHPGAHHVTRGGSSAVHVTSGDWRAQQQPYRSESRTFRPGKRIVSSAFGADDRFARVEIGDHGAVDLIVEGPAPLTLDLAGYGPDATAFHPAAFDVSGRWLALGTLEGSLTVVDTDTGTVGPRVEVGIGPLRVVRPSRDGRWALVVSDRNRAAAIDTHDGHVVRLPGRVTDIAWRADGLVTAVGEELTTWRIPSPDPPTELPVPDGVTSLTYSVRGVLAATVGGVGAVRWLDGARLHASLHPDGTDAIHKTGVFSPDGASYVFTNVKQGGPIRVDTATWSRVERLFDRATYAYARRIGWLDGDQIVGVAFDLSPTVSGLDGDPDRTLQLPGRSFIDLSVAPDHRSALLLDERGALWRLLTSPTRLERLEDSPGATSVAAGPDGLIAIGHADTIHLRGADDDLPRSLPLPSGAVALDVALSADGGWLAAACLDGRVLVWTTDGTLRGVLSAHDERATAVAFDPTGPRLASGGWDDRVRLWQLEPLREDAGALAAAVARSWGAGPQATDPMTAAALPPADAISARTPR